MSVCLHCEKRPCTPPRRLCWKCRKVPAVRGLYRRPSKFTVRGMADFHRAASLPTPTAAAPASAEKFAVLEERARLGLALHHPDDAKLCLK